MSSLRFKAYKQNYFEKKINVAQYRKLNTDRTKTAVICKKTKQQQTNKKTSCIAVNCS